MLAKRISKLTPSITIAISQKAKELKANGKDIVILSVGEPDFTPPKVAANAVKEAADEGNSKYSPISGNKELLEAISLKFKKDNNLNYKLDNIICNAGAKHSLFNIFGCIINEGDEVIIPAPYWVSYPEIVNFYGGKPILIQTSPKNSYKMTPLELKNAINKKTKALVLCNPSNPTGSVYSKKELEEISEILKGTDIFVISDEIYEKIIYDEKYISAGSINDDMFNRTITVNGLSKCGAMPGWRFGYLATANDELAAGIKKLQSQSTSNISNLVLAAALPVLEGKSDDYIEYMRKIYEERRDYCVSAINDIPGLSVVNPKGAFYLFIDCSKVENDSFKFCSKMLDDALVASVPGIGFGMEGHFRISFATSLDELKKGIERIAKFVKNY